MKRTKSCFNCFFAFLIVILLLPSAYPVSGEEVIIYYNKACGGCTDYISEHLIPMLEERGFSNIMMYDYVNTKENRLNLNKINEELGVPPKLQGHFTIFIGKKIVLEGHVPHEVIDYLRY